jgi:hypothetical protein
MITDGIVSKLSADTGVIAVVSTRVYLDVLPRGYILPALVVHQYGGSQGYQFSGPTGVTDDLVQIDVYGKTTAERGLAVAAVTAALVAFVGTLPDNTVVQLCKLERKMDMPFLPGADATGVAYRATLGFCITSKRV